MQTKKKVSARSLREHASPRVTRPQKKLLENVQVAETKAAELITSSPRKQRCGAIPPKKTTEAIITKNMTAGYIMTDEVHNVCLAYDDREDEDLIDDKGCERILETIFSPTFHIPKDNIEDAADFIKYFRSEDEEAISCHMDVDPTPSGPNLSSEVSAIYLAMQQSNLECVDEQNSKTDIYVESDDVEEIDYFDPYLFIKNLPHLSTVVPEFRPVLLPKQTRRCPPTTLVLDLDETLVHSTLEACDTADFTFPVNFNLMKHTVYVRCRPYLTEFMERVAGLFEVIIFTASQSIYAEQLLNVLDPKRRVFRHRVYRDSCVFVEGNYLKDLSILGRDLSRVIIIDNSPQAFGFQVENGIPIESWFDDRSDRELLSLLPFLESLVGVEDVRPLISRKFNLREKIEAAVYPNLSSMDDEEHFSR